MIIMTLPYYESGKSIIMATCYKNGNNNNKSDNNDKFDNNGDKVCLLLRKWGWLGHMLDYVLNHIIIDLVTIALQFINQI